MSTHPLWRAMRHYRTQRGWVALGFFLACITLLAQVGLLALSGWFIAAMGLAGAAGVSINYFTPAAIIRALAILRTAGRYGERLVTHDATLRMTGEWRSWFYGELEKRAPAGIADLHSADTFSRFRADIDRLERFFLQSLLPVSVSLFTLCVVVAVLLWLDVWLAFGMLCILLCAGWGVPTWQARRTRDAHASLASAQTQLRQELAETLQGKAEVLIYGQGAVRLAEADRCSAAIAREETRVHAAESIAQGVLSACIGLGVVLGLARGFMLVDGASLPPSYLAMLPLLCIGCFDTVAALPAALPGFAAARDAASRLYAILDRPVREPGTATVPVASVWELQCYIPAVAGRLRHEVSFALRAGECLVLSGTSGAGKSSIIEWITGLLPLPEGASVHCNDTPQHEAHNWLEQFTIAEQRPHSFTGTVRDNLHIAAPGANDTVLTHACMLAHFPLEDLTHGLDHPLGEQGNNLSGGQRRRLAIARALLRKAPCLILDEPTEGLDGPLAHRMMIDIMAHAVRHNQAVILISHDPSVQHYAQYQIAL